MVESSQTVIRVVGLSATLPNYIDVAEFLSVNPHIGNKIGRKEAWWHIGMSSVSGSKGPQFKP